MTQTDYYLTLLRYLSEGVFSILFTVALVAAIRYFRFWIYVFLPAPRKEDS